MAKKKRKKSTPPKKPKKVEKKPVPIKKTASGKKILEKKKKGTTPSKSTKRRRKKKVDPVVSAPIIRGKGQALKFWWKIRREVQQYLTGKGMSYTKAELNKYASAIYQIAKLEYPSSAENLDIITEDYFTGEVVTGLPSFLFWLLPEELDKLRPTSTIVVDSTELTGDYFQGNVSNYLFEYSSSFIAKTNFKYERKEGVYIYFIRFVKETDEGTINYFLMVLEDDYRLKMTDAEFDKYLKDKGIKVKDIITKTTVVESDVDKMPPDKPTVPTPPKKVPPTPPTPPPAPPAEPPKSTAKEIAELVKELRLAGFDKEEIKEQLKKIN